MKNQIVVTEKALAALNPYQGQNNAMPSIGDVLYVHGRKIPKVRGNGYFVQLTNWRPSSNSISLIKRRNDPKAATYGWRLGAEITIKMLKEKKEIYAFQRWALDYSFVK